MLLVINIVLNITALALICL